MIVPRVAIRVALFGLTVAIGATLAVAVAIGAIPDNQLQIGES